MSGFPERVTHILSSIGCWVVLQHALRWEATSALAEASPIGGVKCPGLKRQSLTPTPISRQDFLMQI